MTEVRTPKLWLISNKYLRHSRSENRRIDGLDEPTTLLVGHTEYLSLLAKAEKLAEALEDIKNDMGLPEVIAEQALESWRAE